MNVLITEQHKSEHATTVSATCGNVEGVVSIGKHSVQVLCVNAAHRAWRGGGRCFASVKDALENYKSPEMKAIIQTAADLCK